MGLHSDLLEDMPQQAGFCTRLASRVDLHRLRCCWFNLPAKLVTLHVHFTSDIELLLKSCTAHLEATSDR